MSIKSKLRSRAIDDKLALKALDKIKSLELELCGYVELLEKESQYSRELFEKSKVLEEELDTAYRLGGKHMIELLEEGYGIDFSPAGIGSSIKTQLEQKYEIEK